jgi:thioredoxin 1
MTDPGATGRETTGEDAAAIQVRDEDHLDDIVADGVVFVDFYADWCGPCVAMETILERVAAETGVPVATVDVETRESLTAQYDVRGVPTILLFSDGEAVERRSGLQDQADLVALAESYA